MRTKRPLPRMPIVAGPDEILASARYAVRDLNALLGKMLSRTAPDSLHRSGQPDELRLDLLRWLQE